MAVYFNGIHKNVRIKVFDGIIQDTRNHTVIYQADRHKTWHKREGDQFSSDDASGFLNLREREDSFAPATRAGMMSSIKCT